MTLLAKYLTYIFLLPFVATILYHLLRVTKNLKITLTHLIVLLLFSAILYAGFYFRLHKICLNSLKFYFGINSNIFPIFRSAYIYVYSLVKIVEIYCLCFFYDHFSKGRCHSLQTL